MTRINSAIKVKLLIDEHLLAEHRELKRLPSVYQKRISSKTGLNNLPTKFTLGTGHVLFFVDKGGFTLNRYKDLYSECLKRGFNVTNYESNWGVYGSNLKDYNTTEEEYQLLIERISDRLKNGKPNMWHYKGKKVTKEKSIEILKEK